MSLIVETMEALKFTDYQNRLILESNLSNGQLAERFGRCVRQIQRQHALLKKLEKGHERS